MTDDTMAVTWHREKQSTGTAVHACSRYGALRHDILAMPILKT